MSIHTVEGQKGLYVRQSTGLVREVSPWSALTFNVLTSVPGFGLAYSVFYPPATYPGGHILSAFWITGAVSLAIALPFVLLTMTTPRSGGDYILGQSLDPSRRRSRIIPYPVRRCRAGRGFFGDGVRLRGLGAVLERHRACLGSRRLDKRRQRHLPQRLDIDSPSSSTQSAWACGRCGCGGECASVSPCSSWPSVA